MKVKLGEIADIQTGYIERKSKKPAEPINISIIQLRDIDVNGVIEYKNLKPEEISTKDRYPKLYPGDVVFAAKGSKRSAGVIDRDIKDITVSNHYLIIRIKDEYKDKINPGYLAFYMRQKPAMDYFELCASGSHIPFVSAGALKELNVVIPEGEKQKQLAELDLLVNKEKQLVEKLQDKKRTYYEQLLTGLIEEVKNV